MDNKKILVIDIGNTETDLAIFRNNHITKTWFIPNGEIREKLGLNIHPSDLSDNSIDKIFIGSVNPQLNRNISQWSREILNQNPVILGPPYKDIISVRYRPVSSLGIDRLADAVGAEREYPVPLVVVDFGTATTFNIVNQNHEFIGGAITTGLEMSRDLLDQKTALLPRIELLKTKGKKIRIIGQSTLNSIQSGLIHGFASMVDGMIERIQKELKISRLTVIATGGYASVIKPYSKKIKLIDTNLTLKGLYWIGLSQGSRQ